MDAIYHQVLIALPEAQLGQREPLDLLAREVGECVAILSHHAPDALLLTYVYRTRDEALRLAARAEIEGIGLKPSMAEIPSTILERGQAVLKRRSGLDVMDLLPPE